MKNIIYLLLATFLISCNDRISVKLPTDLRKIPPAPRSDTQRGAQDFHIIPYADASNLITNFIATFRDDAENVALGGYIPKTTLKSLEGVTYPGVRMYYCRKTPLLGETTMFIATDNMDFDRTNPDFRLPDNASLRKSNNAFVYDRQIVTSEEVKSFLESQNNTCDGSTETIEGVDVKNYNDKFKERFNIIDANGNEFPANHDPYGFMVGSDIDLLLAQRGCKGFRFFWGFNSSINMNKIRIVLIGVDTNNKNIIKDPDDPTKDAKMLERSWPPY